MFISISRNMIVYGGVRFYEGSLSLFPNKKRFQPLSLCLKVLWSLPRSSSLREGCRGRPGPPSASLRSQDHPRKYPVSTAMSPLRSDHSLHLMGEGGGIHKKYSLTSCNPHLHFNVLLNLSCLPCLSCMCPPFITPILLLSMGPGGSGKTNYREINNLNALLYSSHCRVVPLSLPLTKLSHSLNHCMLMHRITVGASSA